MTNDEIRMPNEARMTKSELTGCTPLAASWQCDRRMDYAASRIPSPCTACKAGRWVAFGLSVLLGIRNSSFFRHSSFVIRICPDMIVPQTILLLWVGVVLGLSLTCLMAPMR